MFTLYIIACFHYINMVDSFTCLYSKENWYLTVFVSFKVRLRTCKKWFTAAFLSTSKLNLLANRQDEAWIRSRSPTPKLQTAWIHFPLQGRQGFFEFHLQFHLTYFRQIPRLYSSLVPFTSWVMFCHISDMISFRLVERKIL